VRISNWKLATGNCVTEGRAPRERGREFLVAHFSARARRFRSWTWHPSRKGLSMGTKAPAERFVVLAAVDGVLSDRVTLVGARFAAGIAGAELHLVHVIALPSATTSALPEGRTRLGEASASAQRVHAGIVLGHLTAGDPCHEILGAAARLQADLVIVGTHARSALGQLLLGSVADHVVRRASCPVLVVREKDYRTGFEPKIEAACADCLDARLASAGETMWCNEHSRRHVHGHTHHANPESSFGLGSSIIRP